MTSLGDLGRLILQVLGEAGHEATLCDLGESHRGRRVLITLESHGQTGKAFELSRRAVESAAHDPAARQRLRSILRSQVLVLRTAHSVGESLRHIG
jgi:hypothetical protein